MNEHFKTFTIIFYLYNNINMENWNIKGLYRVGTGLHVISSILHCLFLHEYYRK